MSSTPSAWSSSTSRGRGSLIGPTIGGNMSARTHRRVVLSSALGIAAIFASVMPAAAREPDTDYTATGLTPSGRGRGLQVLSPPGSSRSDPALREAHRRRARQRRHQAGLRRGRVLRRWRRRPGGDQPAGDRQAAHRQVQGRDPLRLLHQGPGSGRGEGSQEGRPVDQGRCLAAHRLWRHRRLDDRARGQGRPEGRRRRRRAGR